LILLEIGADQGEATQQLAHEIFPTAQMNVQKDFAGLDRIVSIQTTE
jgi:methylase of polypeptide subunit release factors